MPRSTELLSACWNAAVGSRRWVHSGGSRMRWGFRHPISLLQWRGRADRLGDVDAGAGGASGSHLLKQFSPKVDSRPVLTV